MYNQTSNVSRFAIAASGFARWLVLLIAIGFSVTCEALVAAERKSQPVDQSTIDRLVDDLVDGKYAVRELATTKLVAIGEPAIDSLLKFCTSSDPEMSYRVISILERIGLEGSPKTLKRVITGLLTVGKQHDQSLILRSRKLAKRYHQYKSDAAVSQLKKMGAKVTELNTHDGLVRFGGGFAAPIMVEPMMVDDEAAIDDIFGADLFTEIEEEIEKLEAEEDETQKEDDGSCGTFDDAEDASDDADTDAADRDDTDEAEQTEIEDEAEAVLKAMVEEGAVVEEGEVIIPRVVIDAEVLELGGGVPRVIVRGGRPFMSSGTSGSSPLHNVVIDSDWTGGSEGLKLLAEVHNLQNVQFNGVELSGEDFDSLAGIDSPFSLNFTHCTFPAEALMKFADEHSDCNISAVGTAMMGVYPTQYTSAEKDGCELQRVAEKSGAEKAGMKAGDVIVKVDGMDVVDFPTLTYTVAGRKPNATLDVVVKRAGKEVKMKLTLSSRADIE